MDPLSFFVLVFGVSVAAGALGSMLGLGGGIIIVPALTLLFDVDIRYAIGASVVSVIATSSGAAAAYVREGFTNLRVAMFLEIGTVAGALTGATLAGHIEPSGLFVLFGVLLLGSAIAMVRRRHVASVHPDDWSVRLRLAGTYPGPSGEALPYAVGRSKLGLELMYLAGTSSGLLGIGSGVLKVPAMDLAMGLPLKVSTATSNFMIGVTAAASAGVYFARGDLAPFVAAPVALGVLAGATAGAHRLPHLDSGRLRGLFVVVLVVVGVQMVLKGAV